MMVAGFIGLVGVETGGVRVAMGAVLAAGVLIVIGVLLILQQSPQRVAEHYERSISEMNRQFEATAGRDWLTGLMTMAELERVATRELARSLRYSRPFSLLFVSPVATEDVTGAEDATVSVQEIESTMGQVLEQTLRVSDMVARRVDELGFVAVLPETDGIGAGAAAERLRNEFGANLQVTAGESGSLRGIRVAAVTYPDDGNDLMTLLQLGKSLVAGSAI